MPTSDSHPKNESGSCYNVEGQNTETAQREEVVETSQDFTRTGSPSSPADPASPSRNPSTSSNVSMPSIEVTASGVFDLSEARLVEPPVTVGRLKELDLLSVTRKPHLRHELNFEAEVGLVPIVDGEIGRRREIQANQFWETLRAELKEFISDRQSFYQRHGKTDEWSLPVLLRTVKEIIHTLDPRGDGQYLEEGLDVDFLMQQFSKGVADLDKLALWLCNVLKSHCAPVREERVDVMYNQLSDGNRKGEVDLLVQGMRSLLSLLEIMRLDKAEHEIRCVRPILLENTGIFERGFFLKQMQAGKLDISPSVSWYREAQRKYSNSPSGYSQAFGKMGIFFEALVDLILPSGQAEKVPNTFYLDSRRIQKLREDMLEAVNLKVCMRLYRILEFRMGPEASRVIDSDYMDNHRKLPRSLKSKLRQETEQHFRGRLLSDLEMRLRRFQHLPYVVLFTAATTGRTKASGHCTHQRYRNIIPTDIQEKEDIADAATRIAHLGIIHWRTWRELAYNGS
ncbi:hypothetical protein S40288_10296 [Stachybotrys chartarum IBT 40288]|nr:hypothetical protein S40288_10296 [Stachybotrys chartarum IBT 40288]